jgi:hypothetical protein
MRANRAGAAQGDVTHRLPRAKTDYAKLVR